jgi:histidine triad (HIT) family protein
MGLEVPHTHIHLIPIQNEGDLNFANKKSISQEEMISIAEQISAKVRL